MLKRKVSFTFKREMTLEIQERIYPLIAGIGNQYTGHPRCHSEESKDDEESCIVPLPERDSSRSLP